VVVCLLWTAAVSAEEDWLRADRMPAGEKGFLKWRSEFISFEYGSVEYGSLKDGFVVSFDALNGDGTERSVAASGADFDYVSRALQGVRKAFLASTVESVTYVGENVAGRIHFAKATDGTFGVVMRFTQLGGEVWLRLEAEQRMGKNYLSSSLNIQTEHLGDEVALIYSLSESVWLTSRPEKVPAAMYLPEADAGPSTELPLPRLGGKVLNFRPSGFVWRSDDGGVGLGGIYISALPPYYQRSSSEEDLAYVSRLVEKTGIPFQPVQAAFTTNTRASGELTRPENVQMVLAEGKNDRLALIVTFVDDGVSKDGRDGSGVLSVECFSERVELPARQPNAQSNIDVPGTYIYVCTKEGFVQQIRAVTSRFNLCKQADKVAVSSEDEALDTTELGWRGKLRRKKLTSLNLGPGTVELANTDKVQYYLRENISEPYYNIVREYSYAEHRTYLAGLTGNLQPTFRCVVRGAKRLAAVTKSIRAAGKADFVSRDALVVGAKFEVTTGEVDGIHNIEIVFVSGVRGELAIVTTLLPEATDALTLTLATQCGADQMSFDGRNSNSDVAGRVVAVMVDETPYFRVTPKVKVVTQRVCNDKAAPCNGSCPAGYTCVPDGGDALCVRCGVFKKRFEPGRLSCCIGSSRPRSCVPGRYFTDDLFCASNDPEVYLEDSLRQPQTRRSREPICRSTENFRRAGAVCRLERPIKDGSKCIPV